MRVYLGQTRSATLIERCTAWGFGECTQPYEYPPRRKPWFADCGTYPIYTQGGEWDPAPFSNMLARAVADDCLPDFVVAPDIVAGGLASLALSCEWVERCATVAPTYLAVQDGMRPTDVSPHIQRFAGIFVGGTDLWKRRAIPVWATLAHKHGKACHVGRAGSGPKVAAARAGGADSIDSCLPLFSRDNMAQFRRALLQEDLRLCVETHWDPVSQRDRLTSPPRSETPKRVSAASHCQLSLF